MVVVWVGGWGWAGVEAGEWAGMVVAVVVVWVVLVVVLVVVAAVVIVVVVVVGSSGGCAALATRYVGWRLGRDVVAYCAHRTSGSISCMHTVRGTVFGVSHDYSQCT